MSDIASPKAAASLIALVVLWLAEGRWPFYVQFAEGLYGRLRHDLRNLLWGGVNVLATAGLLSGPLLRAEHGWTEAGFGLLTGLGGPVWLHMLAAWILLDLWMYLWHRANHRLPWLWRLHRMHHSDTAMDASSALRFHTAEALLSRLLLIPVLTLLGISQVELLGYGAIMLPVICLHHANVSLPRRLDRGLTWLIVPPAMHRVHHSRVRCETDSNYGSVLPFWDRLCGTFRLREDAHGIRQGLDGFDDPGHQSLWAMLRTPFLPRRDG